MGFDEFSSLSSAASELISACKFEAEVKIEPEKVGNKLRLDVETEATVSLGGKFKLVGSWNLTRFLHFVVLQNKFPFPSK